MTLTALPLFSHTNFQLYHACFRPTDGMSWAISGAYPVSLFFCMRGSKASLVIKDTVLTDAFITRNKSNFLYRAGNTVHLSWKDTTEVEFIEIRLKAAYLAALVKQEPKDWGSWFNLTGLRKYLLLASPPPALPKELAYLINTIIHASLKPVAFQELILESKTLELMAGLLAQLQQPVMPDALPEAHQKMAVLAKKHIDANKGKKKFTIISLAQLLDTNETTLKQAFKAMHGKTIFRYFQEKNMQAAMEALQAGQPIADIATRCGYSYISHFSIAFKKEFGVPPSRFQ